ncbi:uncharacterized protein LOC110255734 [Sus scrofa]|uniref:uncharacterized protein LOC110255734 n=1 Tax=Sus scrofa TaxID=9823 RepID=UPI000A2AF532|nr:uncharacterized protein LOC110255734 [Sus scrofa]
MRAHAPAGDGLELGGATKTADYNALSTSVFLELGFCFLPLVNNSSEAYLFCKDANLSWERFKGRDFRNKGSLKENLVLQIKQFHQGGKHGMRKPFHKAAMDKIGRKIASLRQRSTGKLNSLIRAWRGVNSSSRAPALPQGLGPGRDCFGGGVASGAEAGLLTTRIALQESSVSASALCHLGLSVVLGIFAARSSVILQLFHSRNPGPKSQVEVSACLPWEPIKQDQAHRKRYMMPCILQDLLLRRMAGP